MANVMLLTTSLELVVDYGLAVEDAIAQGAFTPFRMTPLLQTRRSFLPNSFEKKTVVAHITRIRGECKIGEVFTLVKEAVPSGITIRQAGDIREVLALGTCAAEHTPCSLAIVAPELVTPGVPNLILKLLRYPEWMGLIPNTWDPDHDSINRFDFVHFSDPV